MTGFKNPDNLLPDRRELDRIIFEALGLTEEEQLEVYRAVVELVKNRLVKARPVKFCLFNGARSV